MQTQTAQIRVTIPVQLQAHLQTKANKFGLGLSAYVKNLLIDDVKDVEYPVYQMSDRSAAKFEKAREDEKSGKLIRVDNLEKFFEDL